MQRMLPATGIPLGSHHLVALHQVTGSTVAVDAIATRDSAFQNLAHSAGVVGRDRKFVIDLLDHIRMALEVDQHDIACALAGDLQQADSIIRLTHGAENIGVTGTGVGQHRAVLHAETTDKGHIWQHIVIEVHLCRMQIVDSRAGSTGCKMLQAFNIGLVNRESAITNIGTGVGMRCSHKNIGCRNVQALCHKLADGVCQCLMDTAEIEIHQHRKTIIFKSNTTCIQRIVNPLYLTTCGVAL